MIMILPKTDILWGTNGVAVARHGLILWENEAASLGIIFKYLPDLKISKFI